MSQTQPSTLTFIFRPPVVWRNLAIAAIVGCILSVANQFDVILRGPINARLYLRIAFNFLVPFVVSSVSAAANRPRG